MSNKRYTKFVIHIHIKKDMVNFKFYPLQKNFKMTTFEDMSSFLNMSIFLNMSTFLVRVQKKSQKALRVGEFFEEKKSQKAKQVGEFFEEKK